MLAHALLQIVSLYRYIIFDQRRLDIIDHVEHGVHNRLHPVWDL